MTDTRRIIGCMSGTSMDAIDVALVDVAGRGYQLRAQPVRCHTQPLQGLAAELRALAEQRPATTAAISRLAHDLAIAHVVAVRSLLGGERADLIAVHGQTIYHAPPLGWQLMQPAPIARAFGVPVVFDLRSADLAAGGQGAPITPLADAILFRHAARSRAVVNLGGFCNVTLLPRGAEIDARAIEAGDVCACNQILDAIARALLDRPFDRDGAWAASGQAIAPAFTELVRALLDQSSAGRSLGTGDELCDWLDRHASRHAGADLARTACAAIAQAIAQRAQTSDEVLLAGGGARNRTLLGELRARLPAPVVLTEEIGIPGAYREAIEMAILGALAQDRVPITLPRVTRVSAAAPQSGCWVLP
ncbi:MAG: anhydro-N-acetylmuramic acid kinase [Planctomycetota bacterium]